MKTLRDLLRALFPSNRAIVRAMRPYTEAITPHRPLSDSEITRLRREAIENRRNTDAA